MEKGITIGMDMGDKEHILCILDAEGEVLRRATVANTGTAIRKYFSKQKPCRIALETGTHSGWVSRILEELAKP